MALHRASAAALLLPLLLAACSASDGAEPEDLDAGRRPTDRPAAPDRPSPDVPRDAPAPMDAPAPVDTGAAPVDAPAPADVPAGCAPREVCGDGRDNDCNGQIDDRCACIPGATQRCHPGPADVAGVGACVLGTQPCAGAGELGAWGACEGAGTPSAETCDNVDNDCDGATDEDLSRECYGGPTGTAGVGPCRAGAQSCAAGAWGACAGEVRPGEETCDNADNDCDGATDEGLARACYTGPEGTSGRGACRAGSQSCAAGAWGTCAGEVTPGREVCDNRTDDDCDGMTDEDCRPCIMATATGSPWQIHRAMGPVCFGRTFTVHGEQGEYAFARVPAADDGAWRPVTAATIDFAEGSALCGRACTCLNGGEFTYFQTFFDVSPGFAVTALSVTMGGVDDGARVSIYNSRYPDGLVEAGSYVYLGGSGTSTNLAGYVAPGRNRVVITHLDDCCSHRSLTGVRVVVNGMALNLCGP